MRFEKRKDVIIYSIIFALINILIVFGKQNEFNNGLTLIALLPIIVLGLVNINNIKEFSKNKKGIYLFLWFIFAFAILISELQNGYVMDSLFLLAVPIVLISQPINIKKAILSFNIGLIPITISALMATISGHHFTSNTVGILCAVQFISLGIYYMLSKKNLKNTLVILALLGVLFYLLLVINSRTSQLVALSGVFVFAFHLLYSNKAKIFSLFKHPKYKYLMMLALGLLIIAVAIVSYIVFDSIFTPKWRPNDISTGRFDIWRTTIETTQLFGHKYGWYKESGLFETHVGPHNIFIGILGYGGIVSLVLFLVFLGVYIFTVLKHYLKKPSNELAVVLVLALVPIVKGTTESMIIQQYYQAFNILFILGFVYFYQLEFNGVTKLKVLVGYNTKVFITWTILVLIFGIYGSAFDFNLSQIINTFQRYLQGSIKN